MNDGIDPHVLVVIWLSFLVGHDGFHLGSPGVVVLEPTSAAQAGQAAAWTGVYAQTRTGRRSPAGAPLSRRRGDGGF
jgi:hypothetical protein